MSYLTSLYGTVLVFVLYARLVVTGEALGAPDHPHRGQTTVTYLLQGEVDHKDSAGFQGTISTGGVQWMDAASGVVHAEMPSAKIREHGGVVEGFQVGEMTIVTRQLGTL